MRKRMRIEREKENNERETIRKIEIFDCKAGKTFVRYELRVDGGINPETEGKLDGLVELRLRELSKDLHGFLERVFLGEVSDLDGAAVAFAVFFHV